MLREKLCKVPLDCALHLDEEILKPFVERVPIWAEALLWLQKYFCKLREHSVFHEVLDLLLRQWGLERMRLVSEMNIDCWRDNTEPNDRIEGRLERLLVHAQLRFHLLLELGVLTKLCSELESGAITFVFCDLSRTA